MAATKQDPLDVLQSMFSEILVQTGKAVLASRKDAPTSMASGIAVNKKITDSLTSYHFALDDLESEITRAKAVLLRDLDKLQEAKRPVPEPEPEPEPELEVAPPQATHIAPPAPMDSDSKQPVASMMANLPSMAAHTVSIQPDLESPRAAPFPDMGGGMPSNIINLDVEQNPGVSEPRKAANTPIAGAQSTPPVPMKSSQSPVAQSKVAPVEAVSQNTSLDDMLILPPDSTAVGSAATADMTGGDLSFTDMEFSLAPPSEASHGAPQAPMQDFDLGSFSQDAGNGLLSLDSFDQPPGEGAKNALGTTSAAGAPAAPMQPDSINTAQASTADSIFELGDGNGMHNMDLDVKLEDGVEGENTFDDLFFDNNDNMDQFDDAFFGLN